MLPLHPPLQQEVKLPLHSPLQQGKLMVQPQDKYGWGHLVTKLVQVLMYIKVPCNVQSTVSWKRACKQVGSMFGGTEFKSFGHQNLTRYALTIKLRQLSSQHYRHRDNSPANIVESEQ